MNKEQLVKLYQKVVDEIDVGLHVIDASGKTVIYNKKMMEIEEMDVHEVLHKRLYDVFMFNDGQESTLMKALIERKRTNNIKQTYFNNRGQKITTMNQSVPIEDNGSVIGAVEIATDVTKLERMFDSHQTNKDRHYSFQSIIGESKTIKDTIETAKRATRTSSSVLIVGETGTGKEIFAQSIHYQSVRAHKPFISQNCAAMPDNLIESILFGTKKGAFTGATDRPGLFEQAEGGTLLLDEINSLSPHLQAKLLRAIQEKTIRRIGATKDTPIDVRIIATINEDPIEAIQQERLRKDLYYRLSVVSLFIPPLRERKEDIPLLTDHFIQKFNRLFSLSVSAVEGNVSQLFQSYSWPGNVRELEHVIEGAMNFITDESSLSASHLPLSFQRKAPSQREFELPPPIKEEIIPLHKKMENVEKAYIEHVLNECNGNITKAADVLKIKRQSLQYRMKKYGIHLTKL